MDLSQLNPQQRHAVTTVEGPMLLIAGAGSGKTRVITSRVAYMIQKHQIKASHILALTFTNKAAHEMKERVQQMLGKRGKGIQVSTFHALCVRILRKHIHALGYRTNFIIYDSHDQLALIKQLMEEADYDTGLIDAKSAHFEIGQAKNARKPAESFLQMKDSLRDQMVGMIYQSYQKTLKGCNAIDFDDIINLTLDLFEGHHEEIKEVLKQYQYIMVDEYQDTNESQYLLLRYLTKYFQNLCAVGDDDQSIYGWRGANIGNILNFKEDYPNAKIIKLEQNYRSTQVVLNAANQVIANNPQRMEKTLWSEQGEGKPIGWLVGDDEAEEIQKVIQQIRWQCLRHPRKYHDYAILFRSNFQSRIIEEHLRDAGLPYNIVGGTNFYERREIRDAVSYLKVIYNPHDEVSLQRVINYPKRGIGKTSLIYASTYCQELELPLIDVLKHAEQYAKIPKEASRSMQSFATLIQRYQHRSKTEPVDVIFRDILEEVGFIAELEKEKADPKTREKRLNCVLELLHSTKLYITQNPEKTLKDYLERLALFSNDEEDSLPKDQIQLMTVHSAKGLEFPYVFMIGMVDGIFPNKRSLQEGAEHEERRLCYVGITRAKKELCFSMAKQRKRYGETELQQASRFLLEIDPSLLEVPIKGEASELQKKERAQKARSHFFDQIKQISQVDPAQ